MVTQELKPSFSNLQLELLKLYANGVNDDQLFEIKSLLGNYFVERATLAMDELIRFNNVSPQDIVSQSKDHFRSENRT